MSNTERSIRVVPFSGKQKDYRMWSRKFLATSTMKGYRDVLLGKTEVPKLVTDLTTTEGKLGSLAITANERGYSDLLLSLSDEVCFGIIDDARTEELPDGCLRTGWLKLEKKFMPRTNATIIKLKKEFAEMSLVNPRDDPDEWVSRLEYVRSRLGTLGKKIDDDDMMIHILNNLPVEYENTVEVMERLLDDDVNPLTIELLREELSLKYEKVRRSLGVPEDGEDDDVDTALVSGYGQFKGRCHGCGKFGHKSIACPNNGKEKGLVRLTKFLSGNPSQTCATTAKRRAIG